MTPRITINRLVVTSGGKFAYDEKFHGGLNIIRGENSSGKSTIMDFIFYALGGEIRQWKKAALECEFAVLEVSFSGHVVTIRRVINDSPMTGFHVFNGSIDEAKAAGLNGFLEYPYKPSEKKESFSQLAFTLIGIPEAGAEIGEQTSNITMHQLLRFIYVDQISRVTAVIRDEDFDSPMLRTAVADLAYGVFDDELYGLQVKIREKERQLKGISKEIRAINEFFKSQKKDINFDNIDSEISSTKVNLDKISAIITNLKEGRRIRDNNSKDLILIQKTITQVSSELSRKQQLLNARELEAKDSSLFITSLKGRLDSIEDSLSVETLLGQFSECPLCDVKIGELEGKPYCKGSERHLKGDFGQSTMLKMRDELNNQIRESTRLQQRRKKECVELQTAIEKLSTELNLIRRNLNEKINDTESTRDNRIDLLYQERGRLEAKVEYLYKLKKFSDLLADYKEREVNLGERIGGYRERIRQALERQRSRSYEAKQRVEKHLKAILARDGKNEQQDFHAVESIDIDYKTNMYQLNGRNNFSASSNALLKNAIHFALLFSSIEDEQFRYPRLLLCDNIEDKGMQQIRTHNFQKAIAEYCENYDDDSFQVIFSTSMIQPDLENTDYCVGEHYTEENKSLKLS